MVFNRIPCSGAITHPAAEDVVGSARMRLPCSLIGADPSSCYPSGPTLIPGWVERAGADRGPGEDGTPAWDTFGLLTDRKQRLRPGPGGAVAFGVPEAVAAAGRDIDVADGIERGEQRGQRGTDARRVQVIQQMSRRTFGDREVPGIGAADFGDRGYGQRR